MDYAGRPVLAVTGTSVEVRPALTGCFSRNSSAATWSWPIPPGVFDAAMAEYALALV